MIVTQAEPRLRLITQPDHARLAAEILGLWHTDGLPGHPRRADLLFAVAEHDNGWRELDAAPYVDPGTGRPHSFLDLPDRLRIEVWTRGAERFASSRPYAGLLILEHARALHRERRGDPDWQSFFDRLDELADQLRDAPETARAPLEDDYRWLALADDVSLALCAGLEGRFDRHGLRGRLSATELRIDPFPLVGSTTFRVPCRYIPDRPYRGDADLGGELAAARWEELSVHLRPLRAEQETPPARGR